MQPFTEECGHMNENETLGQLDQRIAIIRGNLRELVEQAAAYSGAADEERNADRIADQEAKLEELLKRRDALLAGNGRG
jgi:predicted RNA-binding protein